MLAFPELSSFGGLPGGPLHCSFFGSALAFWNDGGQGKSFAKFMWSRDVFNTLSDVHSSFDVAGELECSFIFKKKFFFFNFSYFILCRVKSKFKDNEKVNQCKLSQPTSSSNFLSRAAANSLTRVTNTDDGM